MSGAWVESRADPLKITKNLLFAQGTATADGEPILRANGIFKITSQHSTKSGDISIKSLFDFKTGD